MPKNQMLILQKKKNKRAPFIFLVFRIYRFSSSCLEILMFRNPYESLQLPLAIRLCMNHAQIHNT